MQSRERSDRVAYPKVDSRSSHSFRLLNFVELATSRDPVAALSAPYLSTHSTQSQRGKAASHGERKPILR
jgi:hypothetical protein